MKSLDIITIGEGLVELSSDVNIAVSETFTKFYGGDTLVTGVSAHRMGSAVGYITKLAHDPFGEYLLDAWQLEGLDTSQIKMIGGQNGLYFIAKADGHKSCQYYRKKTAATELSLDDINLNYINSAKSFYATGFVQSLSLNCKEAVKEIYKFSKENNIITAYDPNFSKNVWEESEAIEAFEEIKDYIDIMFLRNDSDALALFGTDSTGEIIKKMSDLAIPVFVLKEYKKGIHTIMNGDYEFTKYEDYYIADATGCDAAFNGAFLSSYLNGSNPFYCTKFANALAMLHIQKIGAVKSIPNKENVEKLFGELYG